VNDDWIYVDSPEKLAEYAKAVADGRFQYSLFVVGPGGVGKSKIFEQYLPHVDMEDAKQVRNKSKYAHWIEGTISPVEFYIAIAKNADRTIVADDCPGLYKDGTSRALLKQLCNTTTPRRVVYQKAVIPGSPIEQAGVDTEVRTRSVLVLIANEWSSMGADISAVNTRAKLVRYVPSLETRIRYAETWLGDREILRYVNDSMKKGKVRRLHFRHLRHAEDFKKSGIEDWRSYLDRMFQPNNLDDIDDDGTFILRWAEHNTECGIFTVGQVCRVSRFRRQHEKVTAVLRSLAEKDLVHELSGQQARQHLQAIKSPVYSLGPKVGKVLKVQKVHTSALS
jgi:hypothetical protein